MRTGVSIFSWSLGLLCLLLSGCSQTPATDATTQPATGNYRTISTNPLRDTDTAKRWQEKGLRLLDDNELDEAEKAFKSALEADVDFGPAHNNLGMVYFRKKDWYSAAWEFEYAKKLMPRQAEPWNNLGLVYEQAGELDRAVEEFRQAVSLDAKNLQYQANLAKALVKRGERTEEVRKLLQTIVDKDTRGEWVLWASQQLSRLQN